MVTILIIGITCTFTSYRLVSYIKYEYRILTKFQNIVRNQKSNYVFILYSREK